jgi:hypothetical protein
MMFFRKSFRLRNNVEKYCRAGQAADDNITWPMCIACWIPKATDTHSEYVILIVFPRQQLLRERFSLLRLRTLPTLLLSMCTPVLETLLVVWLVSLVHADTAQTLIIMSEILPRTYYH